MRVATKLSLFSSLILALTVITIGGVSLYTLNSELTKATIEQQGSVARVAAWGMQKYFPEFKFSVGKEGDIRDLRMPQLPEFTDNDMIDSIAKATGETATIFAWDPKTQDFWRKTTNIVKDNGLRAVGTSLGKKGRVYPVVSKGKTYIGEATILGKDYYTQYSPIKDNSNNVIGILYVGVEKAKSEAFYTNIALSIIITALIVLVVFGVVIVFISNKGVVPIKTLTDTMAKLAAGDLDQKVDALDRVDEIGDMARAVQVFKENEIMRVDLQAKQQEARKQDEARVKILGELTGEFNREVTNILGRVDESLRDLENASRALNDNAETTSHKASNMSATTQQSALSVEQVSAASEEFSASIREIASQVKHTTELLSESVEKTETASTRISRLSESSRKIQEVVSLI
ncbi:MAG: Cache 3/Cache 2 fusion domain-containing protein, partial [Alphaproteobacteria bacterium]|nr:Cache 3/Cache 2 fusion domain-containing protein [Alphaproteobacteria bacterium]